MNFFGGKSQKNIADTDCKVFLTFDDGPFLDSTPQLLRFCEKHNLPASFFLVADRAKALPQLSREIAELGHFIGNHSLDHRYGHFFCRKKHLEKWILAAQETLTQVTGQLPAAFRSPAGVQTPPLKRALANLNLPLVHWTHRFFDSVFPLNPMKVDRVLGRVQAGDIFLLHDIPRTDMDTYFSSLIRLVQGLRARGFHPAALPPESLQRP